MSVLKAKRAELRDALTTAGFAAYSAAPEQAVPPLVFVTPSEPYLSFDETTFGGVLVHLQVTLVVGGGVNEGTADALDDLLDGVLPVIAPLIGTFEVGRPGELVLSGQACIGVAIETQTEIRLEG